MDCERCQCGVGLGHPKKKPDDGFPRGFPDALPLIHKKKPDDGFPRGFPDALPLIHKDTVFCKSILNEFSTKMNMEMPTYNTIKLEGLLPVFISSLVLNGVSYTGSPGVSGKGVGAEASLAANNALTTTSSLLTVVDNASASAVLDSGNGVPSYEFLIVGPQPSFGVNDLLVFNNLIPSTPSLLPLGWSNIHLDTALFWDEIFRATVLVNGAKYTSQKTFSTRKAVEQDVAELALNYISQKKPDDGFPRGFPDALPLIHKMNMEMPTYNTIKPEGLLSVFNSSLVLNGVSYTGGAGKNKKEAAQLAACTVILSLLGDSKMGRVLNDIIKSKVKLYDALHKVSNLSTVPSMANTAHCSEGMPSKGVGAEVGLAANNALTAASSLLTVVDNTLAYAVPDSGNGVPTYEFLIVGPQPSFGVTIYLCEPLKQLNFQLLQQVLFQTLEIGRQSMNSRYKSQNFLLEQTTNLRLNIYTLFS
ncbi:Double-stranded RNA-binding protein 4 [Morus notabilis]|uniref:Double-stranded RNA-binding protein 4 n=1 Tax=Morus notabilis TaxID=981085 RepID=W9RUT9_9ROSA|nr:Double-stranded RNA-binding protein 4 [Morus notabilis]